MSLDQYERLLLFFGVRCIFFLFLFPNYDCVLIIVLDEEQVHWTLQPSRLSSWWWLLLFHCSPLLRSALPNIISYLIPGSSTISFDKNQIVFGLMSMALSTLYGTINMEMKTCCLHFFGNSRLQKKKAPTKSQLPDNLKLKRVVWGIVSLMVANLSLCTTSIHVQWAPEKPTFGSLICGDCFQKLLWVCHGSLRGRCHSHNQTAPLPSSWIDSASEERS